MFDCEKCWKKNCECGYQHERWWSTDRIKALIVRLQRIVEEREREEGSKT